MMSDEQYQGLKDMISEQIKITVNGKIDRLTLENREQGIKLDNYITQDNAWKETAEPIIKMGQNAKGASSVALYIAGSIITLGGAIEIIRQFFKK